MPAQYSCQLRAQAETMRQFDEMDRKVPVGRLRTSDYPFVFFPASSRVTWPIFRPVRASRLP